MPRGFAWVEGLTLGIGLLLNAIPASAVIMRLTPLKDVLAESQFLLTAKVESLPADKPVLILARGEQMKGKFPFPQLTIVWKGDSEARKNDHLAQLRKRLASGLPLVLFATQQGKRYTLFAYTNGTWFQVVGRPVEDRVVWSFTHGEPYLRRTFAGTTGELLQIVRDGLAGKKQPPAPNPKEKPGFGPEIKKDKEETKRSFCRLRLSGLPGIAKPQAAETPYLPSWAVIPTLGIGGPLAVLAMLFPSLFGGTLLVFRSWLAMLTVASLNSTLLIVYLGWGRQLEGTVLGSPQGLWFTMLLVTLAGLLWAWRRHLAEVSSPPTRSEQVILWVSSLGFLGSFLYCWLGAGSLDNPTDPSWKLLLAIGAGFWAGALYVLCRGLLSRKENKPALPTEGVMLWAMLAASVGLTAAWPAHSADMALKVGTEGAVRQVWQAAFPNKQGFVVSAPLIHADRVFVAAAFQKGLSTYGAVSCLDARTGESLWTFDNEGDLQEVFSSPSLANGRIYVGEGFHKDPDCRLFCLDAATGAKKWEFQTESHVESTPCVTADRVVFGAGDDGVYCLDLAGKKVWQYPGPDGDTRPTVGEVPDAVKGKKRLRLHVDASPVVVGDRVYAGSGIGRENEEECDPAVFCLDLRTRKKIWLLALGRQDLPVWGSPVVAGNEVYFGLGNGDILEDSKKDKPTGALLCLDRATGKERWRTPLPNGVVRKPAVDERHVYCGCRDGGCYCLDRRTGRVLWKQDLGSPVVATPALFRCGHCGTARLYAVASGGRVASYDPDTGFLYWALDLGGTLLTSPPDVMVLQTPQGESRRLVFGAGVGGSGGLPAVICLEDKGAAAIPGK